MFPPSGLQNAVSSLPSFTSYVKTHLLATKDLPMIKIVGRKSMFRILEGHLKEKTFLCCVNGNEFMLKYKEAIETACVESVSVSNLKTIRSETL